MKLAGSQILQLSSFVILLLVLLRCLSRISIDMKSNKTTPKTLHILLMPMKDDDAVKCKHTLPEIPLMFLVLRVSISALMDPSMAVSMFPAVQVVESVSVHQLDWVQPGRIHWYFWPYMLRLYTCDTKACLWFMLY